MLSDTEGFVRLPQERIIYTSPPRTSLSLSSPNPFPGNQPFSATSSTGCVHLTNQRLVYLPASPTPHLSSFSAPILHVHNSHVSAPFFGPNIWEADVRPVTGGGLTGYRVVLKLTFRDGGAFDFGQIFERLNDRIRQVVDTATENGEDPARVSAVGSSRLADIHLEELPAYEEHSRGIVQTVTQTRPAELPTVSNRQSVNDVPNDSGVEVESDEDPKIAAPEPRTEDSLTAPSEPPPGYEEVQRQSVAEHLEERLRQAEQDGSSSS